MPGGEELPFVTVVIPARNEELYLGACLRSLLRGRYPHDRWEIIVADGASNDATPRIVQEIARKSPVPIILLENLQKIVPVGLNLAIGHARGEVIIRVDAHAEFNEDYVSRCVRVLQESGADNVGGPVVTLPGGQGTMARAIAAALAHPFGVGNSSFRISRTACDVDTVPFGCFRAHVFERLGLFDERLLRNQDYEMNRRIRQAGGRIYLDPTLWSTYYSRPTLRGLLRQAWTNGYWNALSQYLHPNIFCPRHALPGLFSLGVLLGVVFMVWGAIAPFPFGVNIVSLFVELGLAAYAVGLLWSTVSLAQVNRWRLFPFLLLVFPAFHFMYGAGIIWGWLRAPSYWLKARHRAGIPKWDDRRAETDIPEQEAA